jgi:hypothetical protein
MSCHSHSVVADRFLLECQSIRFDKAFQLRDTLERLGWAPSQTLRIGLAITFEWLEKQVLLTTGAISDYLSEFVRWPADRLATTRADASFC